MARYFDLKKCFNFTSCTKFIESIPDPMKYEDLQQKLASITRTDVA